MLSRNLSPNSPPPRLPTSLHVSPKPRRQTTPQQSLQSRKTNIIRASRSGELTKEIYPSDSSPNDNLMKWSSWTGYWRSKLFTRCLLILVLSCYAWRCRINWSFSNGLDAGGIVRSPSCRRLNGTFLWTICCCNFGKHDNRLLPKPHHVTQHSRNELHQKWKI